MDACTTRNSCDDDSVSERSAQSTGAAAGNSRMGTFKSPSSTDGDGDEENQFANMMQTSPPSRLFQWRKSRPYRRDPGSRQFTPCFTPILAQAYASLQAKYERKMLGLAAEKTSQSDSTHEDWTHNQDWDFIPTIWDRDPDPEWHTICVPETDEFDSEDEP